MSDLTAAEEQEVADRMLDYQIEQHQEQEALAKAVAELRQLAIRVSRMTPDAAALADSVGFVREVERKLADTRHRWERLTAEMDELEPSPNRVDPTDRAGAPVAVGEAYELVPQFKNVYTFNTPAILKDGADATGTSPTDVLMDAIGSGAARLTWTITKLQQFCSDKGIVLRIGPDAVSNHDGLDAPMVGKERTQAGVKRVPLRIE